MSGFYLRIRLVEAFIPCETVETHRAPGEYPARSVPTYWTSPEGAGKAETRSLSLRSYSVDTDIPRQWKSDQFRKATDAYTSGLTSSTEKHFLNHARASVVLHQRVTRAALQVLRALGIGQLDQGRRTQGRARQRFDEPAASSQGAAACRRSSTGTTRSLVSRVSASIFIALVPYPSSHSWQRFTRGNRPGFGMDTNPAGVLKAIAIGKMGPRELRPRNNVDAPAQKWLSDQLDGQHKPSACE